MDKNAYARFDDLETAYEAIAEAVDDVPESQERLFLAKLCLALCHRITDPERVREAIREARTRL